MWPYKPISWDKYYSSGIHEKQNSITSGLAAGITIGVFFTVFLLTFGCRLYSRRMATASASERQHRQQVDHLISRLRRRLSLNDLFACPPSEPPPAYDIAIRLPKTTPKDVLGEPPPFSEIYNSVVITTPDAISTSSSAASQLHNHQFAHQPPPTGGCPPYSVHEMEGGGGSPTADEMARENAQTSQTRSTAPPAHSPQAGDRQ